MTSPLTISEVADLTGLPAHTLRYYERAGLLDRVDRSAGNQRRYDDEDIIWVRFLLRLRNSGMSVSDMQRFAELRRAGDHTIAQRLQLLREHRRRVDERIAVLRDNAAELDSKIEHYETLIESTELDGSSLFA